MFSSNRQLICTKSIILNVPKSVFFSEKQRFFFMCLSFTGPVHFIRCDPYEFFLHASNLFTTMCISISVCFMYMLQIVLYLGFLFVNVIFWGLFHISTKQIWLILFNGCDGPFYNSILFNESPICGHLYGLQRCISEYLNIHVIFHMCKCIFIIYCQKQNCRFKEYSCVKFLQKLPNYSDKHFTIFISTRTK